MTTITVHDMIWDGCEESGKGALEEFAGVESVTDDREAGTADIEGEADVDALVEAVDFAGYEAEAPDGEE
jgi:copper chaperone CopZ